MTAHLFPSRPSNLHEAIWKHQRDGGYSIAALRRMGYKVSFMRNYCIISGNGDNLVACMLTRKAFPFPEKKDALRYVGLQMYNWRNNDAA